MDQLVAWQYDECSKQWKPIQSTSAGKVVTVFDLFYPIHINLALCGKYKNSSSTEWSLCWRCMCGILHQQTCLSNIVPTSVRYIAGYFKTIILFPL